MGTLRRKLQARNGSCGYCYQQGHDASACNLLKLRVEAGNVHAKKFHNSISGGGRVCGFCAEGNHSSTNCPSRFYEYKHSLSQMKSVADKAFAWLHEVGFGPGAMLSAMAAEYGWRADGKDQKMVIIEEFNDRVAAQFFQELLWGQQRNWYHVKAVDTANDNVRRIYLPFHPVYAPRPTSMKVQVVHKANEIDIEKMKMHLTCYHSPVMLHETAESFFAEGYKFEAGNNKDPKINYVAYNANQKRNAK